MKKYFYLAICMMAVVLGACSKVDNNDSKPGPVDKISYNLLSADSARLFFPHEKMHEQITPLFIDLSMRQANYPYNEWYQLALGSIQPSTPENQSLLESIAERQNKTLDALGIKLPIGRQIDVIDMSMDAFDAAMAFTAGTRLYFNMYVLHNAEQISPAITEMLVWHEVWHVISRNNPDLRRKMYALIGFKVLDEEIDIPDEVRKHILCNPDVERHDSYATFTINGKPTDCMLMLYAKEDEYQKGKDLNSYLASPEGYWLLALDSQTHKPYRDESGKWVVYNCTEASDFEEIMSNGNTTYCDDPEECMADNFTSAIMNDPEVPNQKLLQDIRTLLQK